MSKENPSMTTVIYKLRSDPENLIRVYNVDSVFVWQESIMVSYYLKGECAFISLLMADISFFNVV